MISHLDHLVLTVRDLEASIAFYTRALGMETVTFGDGRKALRFGAQKINLHRVDESVTLKAQHPTFGSADLCFIVEEPLDEVAARLAGLDIAVLEGPVGRSGARGRIRSVYVRDPDGNLIELSRYEDDGRVQDEDL